MLTLQPAHLLRIYVGNLEKCGHVPLYEALVYAALKQGLAGATVTKGQLAFGANRKMHTAKLIDLVDTPANIARFLPEVERLLTEAGGGGLVTLRPLQAAHF